MTKVTQCRCYNCRNKVGRCMNHTIKGLCLLCMNPDIEINDLNLCSKCYKYMDKVCSH